ncbi:MAG TPA: TonB-dependent receptor, partial [Vicinamibacteria bacterium]
PIGTYSLRFELPGFTRVVREGVRVDTGFTAEVNVKLAVSTREETVTVSGESPVVNTGGTSIVSNYTRELLDRLPSARDPWVMLEQTPGVVMNQQNVGGNLSGQQSSFVAHGSDRNQMWNLDGATITDMAANSSPGYYDFDSFEEIQITTGGNDASQDSGGVSLNFVTKSGGNTFHGSSRVFLVDKGLQSNNITPALRAQGAGQGAPIKSIKEYGFELGGPIKKDKAWFWGGYSQSDVKVGVIGFLKPGATDPYDADSLETDLTTLKNLNLKLTYQWAKGHKSSFLYNRGDKARNARDAGPLRPVETTVRQTSPGYMAFFDHQWIASDRFTLDLKASHVDGGFLLDFHSDELATVQPTFDIVTSMNGRSGTRNEYIRPTTEVRLDANYFLPGALGGDHSTKFGVRYRSTPYQQLTQTGGGATARFRDGVAAEANILRDGHTNRGLWEYSAYADDSYRRGRFTVGFGLRFDFQDDEARAAHVAANPILPDRLPALSFSGADSGATFADISPRLRLIFDLRGTGKTLLKTNLARYYGLGIYTAGTISPTGQTTLRYPWNDRNGDRVVQREELDLTRLLTSSTNYDPANPAAVRSPATVDPGLGNDITDELTATVEHELMKDFAVSLSYMYRHYQNTSTDFRVGLSSSQFVAVPFTANCGNGTCDQASYGVTYWQLPFTRPAET